MKGMADFREKIFALREMYNCFAVTGLDNRPKKAVIRPHKKMVFRFKEDRSSVSPHPGINYGNMDAPFWKKVMGLLDDACPMDYGTSLYVVTDIDYPGLWVDREDDPLHDTHIRITEAKIGCQGDDARDLHNQFSTNSVTVPRVPNKVKSLG
jgi:hypothetical protein